MEDEKLPSLRLEPNRELAAQLIADGVSQTDAARHPDVHVTKQTMNRWCRHDEDFQARVDALRVDLDDQAREVLESGRRHAAQVVVDTMKNTPADLKEAKLKFDAAKYLLDLLKVKGSPGRRANPAGRVRPVDKLTDDEVEELGGE